MVKKVISKEAKPKRVVTNLKPNKKAPTKSELECQVKNLQLANDALEESNRQKIKLLESFEAKISNLENQIEYLSHKDIMHSKETQTEANLNLKCDECNFEAEYERELGWHMGKVHGWPSEQKGETMDISLQSMDPRNCDKCGYEAESLYVLDAHIREVHDESIECNFCDLHALTENKDESIACYYCGEKFISREEIMKHNKETHSEKVSICRYFSTGNCMFENETCWYIHTKTSENNKVTIFKCSLCDKVFKVKPDLMNHKKQDHRKNIPLCIKANNGNCRFGPTNCWFDHSQIEIKDKTQNMSNNENEEMIQKIFDMMEKFTVRIVQIENKI